MSHVTTRALPWILAAPLGAAQTLVENINTVDASPDQASSHPWEPTVVGDWLYFSATHPTVGWELLRLHASGGTMELVADLEPGQYGSSPEDLLGLPDGRLVFVARVDAVEEPWISDGTAEGTVRLGANLPTGQLEQTFQFVEHGGQAYFYGAAGPGELRSLWRTTSTLGEVELVDDFGGVQEEDYGQTVTSTGDELWYTAAFGATWHLYRGDGSPGGATLVEVNALEVDSSLFMWPAGDNVVLSGFDAQLGGEVWVSDGTPQGTEFIDIYPGPTWSNPIEFVVSGDEVYFPVNTTTGGELYRSDGTVAGTVPATDFNALVGPNATRPTKVAAVGSELYFRYDDGTGIGLELWKSSGVPGTEALVADVWPGPDDGRPHWIAGFAGKVYFSARDSAGWDVFGTDGTPAGTFRLTDFAPEIEDYPAFLTPFAGLLYFRSESLAYGVELFASDGTPEGTALVEDLRPDDADDGSAPTDFTSLGDRLVFAADGGEPIGGELWVADDPIDGAALVVDLSPTPFGWDAPQRLMRFGGRGYFSANDGVTGIELWRTDGSAAGTELAHEFIPGPAGGQPEPWLVWRDRLYLLSSTGPTGRELWVSDGSAASLVADIRPGTSSSGITNAVTAGDAFFFTADDGVSGRELWRSDGSGTGTSQVTDLAAGADSAFGPTLDGAWFDGRLYFVARTSTSIAPELYRTDGTHAGTELFASLGTLGGSPSSLTVVGDRLVFRTHDDSTDSGQLWSSDGVAVTQLTSAPYRLLGAAGRVFANDTPAFAFVWRDGLGHVLMATDGTPAGTNEVLPLEPLNSTFEVQQEWVATSGPHVLFLAQTVAEGAELWSSDGTAAGTLRLTEYGVGPVGSFVDEVARHGDDLWFAAHEPLTGAEPVALPIASFGGWVLEPFGIGCPGSNGVSPTLAATGVPTPGGTMELTVEDAAPGGAVGHYFSSDYAFSDFAGCELYLASLSLLLAAPVGLDGVSSLSVPIAPNPALAGAAFWLQSIALDPGGALLGIAGLTPALEVVFAP